MTLREFLHIHHSEIVEAYRTALRDGEGREKLIASIQEFFADVAKTVKLPPGFEFLVVGASPATVNLRTRIDQLSRRSRAPLWIYGENGTGRRHVARALHSSTYPEGDWLELDDASQLEELERRSSSLQKRISPAAQAGMTVYVPELSSTAAELQTRLAQLLDEQRLPIRVVASSSFSLGEAVHNGQLRKDLVLRFSNELKVPPLRERKEDIPPLLRHFAELCAAMSGLECTRLSPSAMARVIDHDWPGNVAELRAFVARLSSEFGPAMVQAADLPSLSERPSGEILVLPAAGIDLLTLEKQLLAQAMAMAENNYTGAARLLGLSRDQMRYRVAKFELSREGTPPNSDRIRRHG